MASVPVMLNKPDKIIDALRSFDALPDDAIVPTKITARLTGLSERTIRSHKKLRRHYVSTERYGQRAGDVRALLRDGWESLGTVAERIVDRINSEKKEGAS